MTRPPTFDQVIRGQLEALRHAMTPDVVLSILALDNGPRPYSPGPDQPTDHMWASNANGIGVRKRTPEGYFAGPGDLLRAALTDAGWSVQWSISRGPSWSMLPPPVCAGCGAEMDGPDRSRIPITFLPGGRIYRGHG